MTSHDEPSGGPGPDDGPEQRGGGPQGDLEGKFYQRLAEAREALDSGDQKEAHSRLSGAFFPYGLAVGEGPIAAGLDLLADIMCAASDDDERFVRELAANPSDVNLLLPVGIAMIHWGMNQIAAAVLRRADALAPDRLDILEQYFLALEEMGLHQVVCMELQKRKPLLEREFKARVWLAAHTIMRGETDQIEQWASFLGEPQDQAEIDSKSWVCGMVERIRELKRVEGRLRDDDLRGWNFVINGSVLLQLPQYGFESMKGRYFYIQDSYGACRDAIARIRSLLELWEMSVPRVYALPDAHSRILGAAAATAFRVPLEPWPDDGSNPSEPGLIVAYCFSNSSQEVFSSLRQHRPGQILWSHSSPSFTYVPVGPDLTSFFFGSMSPPWGWEDEGVNLESCVSEILGAGCPAAGEGYADDLNELLALCREVRGLSGDAGPSALRRGGARRPQLKVWPVPGPGLTQ